MSDEYYSTPEILSLILPYVNPEWVIYEPFPGEGHLRRFFEDRGHIVLTPPQIDFLKDPTALGTGWYDVIVTNPPFSKLDKVVDCLYRSGKPFFCIMPLPSLGGLKRHALYKEKGLGLIMPEGRMCFIHNGEVLRSPNFYSVWATHNVPGIADNTIAWL